MTDTHRKKGLFITGTDTGVGKTIVAAGLVRLARRQGIRAVAVKPVETGCAFREGTLYPEDGVFLREASQRDLTLDECVPFRFSLSASPARAAAMENRSLNISDLEEHIRTLPESADLIVVEGAGGLMVPIQERFMMIDLAERLNYPVLLVARKRLGTVNHTLLSVSALKQRAMQTAGIVVSCSSDNAGPEEEFTPSDIAWLVGDIPVVLLPHLAAEAAGDPDKIAIAMSEGWPKRLLNQWIGLEGPEAAR